ncbi:MAG: flagellar filament capping protein FliD [Desulfovibrionaceae bacterium]
MAITFPGLGSGMDVNALMEGLLEARSQKLYGYKKEKLESINKEDVFGDLKKALEELEKASESLNSPDKLLDKKLSSSNEGSVGIKSQSGAILEGSYSVEVGETALPSNASLKASPPITDPKQVINNMGGVKEFTYEINGKQKTIELADGVTIEDLVNVINRDPGNPGVQASLLKDGGEYIFRLQSKQTGLDNSIQIIDGPNTVPGFESSAGGWEVQVGRDSQYRINGYPSSGWLSSDSNSINDIIPGATVELRSKGVSSISVEMNPDKMEEKITEFVEKANVVLDILNDVSKSAVFQDPDMAEDDKKPGKGDGYIVGDYTSIFYNNSYIKRMQDQLGKVFSSRIPGFELYDSSKTPPTGDRYIALGGLGITTNIDSGSDKYGKLEINKDKLKEAINEDPLAVANLFSAKGSGKVNTEKDSFIFGSALSGITEPGTYEVKYDIDASGAIVNATIGGEPAIWDSKLQTLSATTGGPRGISLKITNFSQDSYAGTVSIQEGIFSKLDKEIDEMFYLDGTMFRFSESLKKDLESINKNIVAEEKRLKEYQETLQTRFTKMDLKISKMNGILSQLAGFIGMQQ